MHRAIVQASTVRGGNSNALAAAFAIANAASTGSSSSSVLAQALVQAVAQGANASAVSEASQARQRVCLPSSTALYLPPSVSTLQALAQATSAPSGTKGAVPELGDASPSPASAQAFSQALSSGNTAVIAESLAQSSGGENPPRVTPTYCKQAACFCLVPH